MTIKSITESTQSININSPTGLNLSSQIFSKLNSTTSSANLIPLSDCYINDRFQRSPQKQLIGKIVNNFDVDLFGILTYVEIDGKKFLADGQQRALAAYKLGLNSVPAIGREGTIQDLERIFSGINVYRNKVKSIELFLSKVHIAQDENKNEEESKELKLYNLAQNCGYEITSDRKNNKKSIHAYGQFIKLTEIDDEMNSELYPSDYYYTKLTLNYIRNVWNHENHASGVLMCGIGRFLVVWDKVLNRITYNVLKKFFEWVSTDHSVPNSLPSQKFLESSTNSTGQSGEFNQLIHLSEQFNKYCQNINKSIFRKKNPLDINHIKRMKEEKKAIRYN